MDKEEKKHLDKMAQKISALCLDPMYETQDFQQEAYILYYKYIADDRALRNRKIYCDLQDIANNRAVSNKLRGVMPQEIEAQQIEDTGYTDYLLQSIPSEHRALFAKFFIAGYTLKEIGKTEGYGESRASQRKKQLVEILRGVWK